MARHRKATQSPEEPLAIVFHQRPTGPAGAYSLERLTPLLEKFGKKLSKHSPVQTIEVFLHMPKNPVGKTVAYTVILHTHLWSGKRYVARAEQYVSHTHHVGLEACVRETIRETEEQIRRKKR